MAKKVEEQKVTVFYHPDPTGRGEPWVVVVEHWYTDGSFATTSKRVTTEDVTRLGEKQAAKLLNYGAMAECRPFMAGPGWVAQRKFSND